MTERGTFRRSRELIGCANGFRIDDLASMRLPAQNEYFNPNWIWLIGRAVEVMTPKP